MIKWKKVWEQGNFHFERVAKAPGLALSCFVQPNGYWEVILTTKQVKKYDFIVLKDAQARDVSEGKKKADSFVNSFLSKMHNVDKAMTSAARRKKTRV